MPKKNRVALPLQTRLQVWEKYIGTNIHGYCFVCERASITFGINVEYGHVIAVANGGKDEIENLRPICGSCNRSMGTQNLLEYKMRLIQSGACATADISFISVGDILRKTFWESRNLQSPVERQIFDRLQLITDSKISFIAALLGIRVESPHIARIMIAKKQYILPRSHIRAHSCIQPQQDEVRELIIELDDVLLANIFGSPELNSTTAQLRVHAFSMLGFLIPTNI